MKRSLDDCFLLFKKDKNSMNEDIKEMIENLDDCRKQIPVTIENLDYIAKYGWQKFFGEDTYTFGYINSYKEAGDILVEKKMPDALIFPIMFCYRHYLEQLLKNICKMNMRRKEYKEFIYIVSHNLLKIWNYAKGYLKESHSEDDIDLIQEMVYWFNQHDPDSFVFRYETDKKNRKSIKKDSLSIDTFGLKIIMDEIDLILRNTYDSV